MNWRRFALAFAVTAFVTLVVDVLLNAVLFRAVYAEAEAFLLPARDLNARVLLGWASMLLITAAFGYLIARGGWRGARGGLAFGAVLAIASLAGVAGLASIVPWPASLLAVMAVQQAINSLLLGLLFALLYRGPIPAAV